MLHTHKDDLARPRNALGAEKEQGEGAHVEMPAPVVRHTLDSSLRTTFEDPPRECHGIPVHEGTVPILRQISGHARHFDPVHRARRGKESDENLHNN